MNINLFQRYRADEFAEDYEEGRLTRRDSLKLIVSVTGWVVAANSILAGCVHPPEAVEIGVVHPTDTQTPNSPPASDSPIPESASTKASPSATTPHGQYCPTPRILLQASFIQFPTADILAHVTTRSGAGCLGAVTGMVRKIRVQRLIVLATFLRNSRTYY